MKHLYFSSQVAVKRARAETGIKDGWAPVLRADQFHQSRHPLFKEGVFARGTSEQRLLLGIVAR